MAMTQKALCMAPFVAVFVCFTVASVAAIDKPPNQFYLGADKEIVLVAGNISALQVDEPNHVEDKKFTEVPSEVLAHTHSHVNPNTAAKSGDVAPAAGAVDKSVAVPSSSEIECPCAHELNQSCEFRFAVDFHCSIARDSILCHVFHFLLYLSLSCLV